MILALHFPRSGGGSGEVAGLRPSDGRIEHRPSASEEARGHLRRDGFVALVAPLQHLAHGATVPSRCGGDRDRVVRLHRVRPSAIAGHGRARLQRPRQVLAIVGDDEVGEQARVVLRHGLDAQTTPLADPLTRLPHVPALRLELPGHLLDVGSVQASPHPQPRQLARVGVLVRIRDHPVGPRPERARAFHHGGLASISEVVRRRFRVRDGLVHSAWRARDCAAYLHRRAPQPRAAQTLVRLPHHVRAAAARVPFLVVHHGLHVLGRKATVRLLHERRPRLALRGAVVLRNPLRGLGVAACDRRGHGARDHRRRRWVCPNLAE